VRLLQEMNLWAPLLENLKLVALSPEVPLDLAKGLSVVPLEVPHRDEHGVGTFAFRIQGPSRSLLYVPDIDDWRQWPAARQIIAGVDVSLADASFYSIDELSGRPPVAHPLAPDTVDFFAGLPSQLILTHLNHTNRLLEGNSAAKEALTAQGVSVAQFGQIISL